MMGSVPSPLWITTFGSWAMLRGLVVPDLHVKYATSPSHQNHTGTASGRPFGDVVATQISRMLRSRASTFCQGKCPRVAFIGRAARRGAEARRVALRDSHVCEFIDLREPEGVPGRVAEP